VTCVPPAARSLFLQDSGVMLNADSIWDVYRSRVLFVQWARLVFTCGKSIENYILDFSFFFKVGFIVLILFR
jgi:hypothetical protein